MVEIYNWRREDMGDRWGVGERERLTLSLVQQAVIEKVKNEQR